MKLTPQKLDYYDWDDIQAYLCEAMGIEEKYFRAYHEVVGGEYKDFWHFWLWFVDDNVHNGGYSRVYLGSDYGGEYFLNKLKERFGEWALDILPAISKLSSEIDPDEDGIIIYYNW